MNPRQREIKLRLLFAIQAGLCCHCWKAMQPLDGTKNDPMAPSLEHLQAKAHGGNDRIENLLAAHRKCNQERGLARLSARAKQMRNFAHAHLAALSGEVSWLVFRPATAPESKPQEVCVPSKVEWMQRRDYEGRNGRRWRGWRLIVPVWIPRYERYYEVHRDEFRYGWRVDTLAISVERDRHGLRLCLDWGVVALGSWAPAERQPTPWLAR